MLAVLLYARKLKFGKLLTQTYTFSCVLELALGHARGKARVKMYTNL